MWRHLWSWTLHITSTECSLCLCDYVITIIVWVCIRGVLTPFPVGCTLDCLLHHIVRHQKQDGEAQTDRNTLICARNMQISKQINQPFTFTHRFKLFSKQSLFSLSWIVCFSATKFWTSCGEKIRQLLHCPHHVHMLITAVLRLQSCHHHHHLTFSLLPSCEWVSSGSQRQSDEAPL